MAINKASDLSGGTFFDPKAVQDALGLLVEPARVDKDVTYTKYQSNETAKRDEATANVTVFKTSENLAGTVEPEVLKGVRVVHSMLVSSLEKVVGDAMIGVIRKIPTKSGSGYAFRDPDAATINAIEAWYNKREAGIAAAIADAPDFDS